MIGKTTSLVANVSDYKVDVIDPEDANVSLTLDMTGTSSVAGKLSMSVDAEQQWDYVGGQWQIARETWTFVAFDEQYPVSATTFPHWTAMEDGQNPNLVSEKSFEWLAGPYIAASVHAFLAGLLAYGAIRLREKGRSRAVSP